MATGGCQCGAVRYEVVAPPRGLYVCHCLECRHQSASAFGISVRTDRAAFRVTQGQPKSWTRATDSGRRLRCWFCPDCGSRLWHEPEQPGETVTVKGGSLDQPPDITKAVHLWTVRKLPGVVIPAEAVQFPREPD